MNLRLFVFLFALLISLQPALADFSASTQGAFRSCGCELIENRIVLVNDGALVEEITISQTGQAAKWSTIAPNFVALLPGETQTVMQFIKPSCASPGTYGLSLSFAGQSRKSLDQQFSVGQCAINATAPTVGEPALDPARFEEVLWYGLIGMTVLLVIVLVLVSISAALRPAKKSTHIEPAKPLEVRHAGRYPWESYFARGGERKAVERQKSKSLVPFLLFIILIIVLAITLWYFTQTVSIPGNLTNASNISYPLITSF